MAKKRSAPAKKKSTKSKGDFLCRQCGSQFEGVLVDDSLTQSDTDCPLCGPQNPKPLVDVITPAAGEVFTGDTSPGEGKRPKPAPEASEERKSASRTAPEPPTNVPTTEQVEEE